MDILNFVKKFIRVRIGENVIPPQWFNKKEPFLYRPYLAFYLFDNSRIKIVMKARQLGFTETQIAEFLYFAYSLPNTSYIYTLPRGSTATYISNQKFDVIINPSLRGSKWSATIKNIKTYKPDKESSIYIKSGWNKELGEGLSADGIIFDEYDKFSIESENAYLETLSSSNLKIIRYLSTPTIPNYGIFNKFKESDMKIFMWKCSSCSKWQELDEENLVLIILKDEILNNENNNDKSNLEDLKNRKKEIYFYPDYFNAIYDVENLNQVFGTLICKYCKKKFDKYNSEKKFIKHQKSEISGYKISQLDTFHISATEIMKKLYEFKNDLFSFYNYVLAKPYMFSNYKFNSSNIKRKLHLKKNNIRIAGIDWGKRNYIIILELISNNENQKEFQIIDFFTIEDKNNALQSTKEILNILKNYYVDLIIADWGYGYDRVLYLSDYIQTCGAKYTRGEKIFKVIKEKKEEGKTLYTIYISRINAFKLLIDRLNQGYFIFPENKNLNELLKHFENIYYDEKTNNIISISNDDYAHALLYAMSGFEILNLLEEFSFNFQNSKSKILIPSEKDNMQFLFNTFQSEKIKIIV